MDIDVGGFIEIKSNRYGGTERVKVLSLPKKGADMELLENRWKLQNDEGLMRYLSPPAFDILFVKKL